MPTDYEQLRLSDDELQTSYQAPRRSPDADSNSLPLTVLFTTVGGTLSALREAAILARHLGAQIRILVPYVVPYPLPLDRPRVSPEFRLRYFRTRCSDEAIETRIDVRLCRDVRQCLQQSLYPQTLIVVGGVQSWWPFTFEKRLMRHLSRAGHHVIAC